MTRMFYRRMVGGLMAGLTAWSAAWAVSVPYPTVSVQVLPQALRSVWREQLTEMTDQSHCAAAFDSYSDSDKMVFRCSIHIRLSAEGARRAMRYCEQTRQEKGIKSPCRLIED
jgi:hypothetical protein